MSGALGSCHVLVDFSAPLIQQVPNHTIRVSGMQIRWHAAWLLALEMCGLIAGAVVAIAIIPTQIRIALGVVTLLPYANSSHLRQSGVAKLVTVHFFDRG